MRLLIILISIIFLAGCSKDSLNSSNGTANGNGTGGSLARFTLVGNYLYLVEDASLKTFDVTNPANPVLANTLTIGSGVETIYPYKNNLFIGSQTGMFIYSISNPAAPQYAGAASHVRTCDPVVANDVNAFVTLRSGTECGAPTTEGLYIYNLTNLQSPLLLNTLPLSTPYGVGIKNNTVFVCRGSNGLAVIDVTNAGNPAVLQTITGGDFRDVIPYNDLLICYVTTGISLYDISNVNNIRFIKKVNN